MRKSRRISRGGKRGGYSGRGIKGQKSRAGAKIRPAIRDLMMKLPKQRGVRFKSLKIKPIILNLNILEKNFKSGEVIDLATLIKKRLIRVQSGKASQVKILGDGELSKKLVFEGVLLSKSARLKIEKAGGEIREIRK